jgi:hypothetical protein
LDRPAVVSDASAAGFLAVIAAVSAGFGALEERRQELDELRTPARVYVVVTGAVMLAMVIAAAVILRDAVAGERWTWPRATVLGTALVWVVLGAWLISRCRRVQTYGSMIDRWTDTAGRDRPREGDG